MVPRGPTYVYKNRNINDEHLKKLSRNLPPCVITQLSDLPRNKHGFVDENKLCEIPTIDHSLQQQKILSVARKCYPKMKITISKEHKSAK